MDNLVTIQELSRGFMKFKPFILSVKEVSLGEEITFLTHSVREAGTESHLEIPDFVMSLVKFKVKDF